MTKKYRILALFMIVVLFMTVWKQNLFPQLQSRQFLSVQTELVPERLLL